MLDPISRVARALLYEGFALYPYRASALKNRGRWFFGGVYPPAWTAANPGDRDHVGAQMLLQGFDFTAIDLTVRFLQFDAAGGATERCVELAGCTVGELLNHPRSRVFELGEITLSAAAVGEAFLIELRVRNHSDREPADRDEALPYTMASLHAVLKARDGEWISLLDPPPLYAAAAASCQQTGLHPVLAGRAHDTVLASPIVLYDDPQIAPESPGDLFDGTEIDEILTLRLQTLAESEVAELAHAEPRVREAIERARSLEPQRMSELHGALRVPGSSIAKGSRVRLKPRQGGDIFDSALAGRIATVTAVEHDFDGGVHFAVVLDDDPGADLGEAGFHGHRFFFQPGEVEAL